MKNGLYSIHIPMLDGVKGRDSGVLILRDGVLIGGGPYFWSAGAYTVGGAEGLGKEYVEAHSGGRSGSLDDYRRLTTYDGLRKHTRREREQDKGHFRQFAKCRLIPANVAEYVLPCVHRFSA